jgi:hypothetical protein
MKVGSLAIPDNAVGVSGMTFSISLSRKGAALSGTVKALIDQCYQNAETIVDDAGMCIA